MKKYLPLLILILFFHVFTNKAYAQGVVSSGAQTQPVNFPAGPCAYNWVNNNTSVGLAASGTGNIPSFTAVNKGSSPVTATIIGTPVPTPGFAYITDVNNNTLSVINLTTGATVASIPLGGTFPGGIALSPDGSRVYVANNSSNSVSVINTTTNTLITTIPLTASPGFMAMSPDGSYVYVTNQIAGTVSVIATATNSVIANIQTGYSVAGVLVSPDGSKVYITASNQVLVINTSTNSVTATISIGADPIDLAQSPDGKLLYVSNYMGGSISVINTVTNTVVSTIPCGNNPYAITISNDGSKLYVANSPNDAPGSITVINTANGTIVNTINLSLSPYGIELSPDNSLLYVEPVNGATMLAINTVNNTVASTIPVSGPFSFGNFISAGVGCGDTPVTFTITVNPVNAATITATPATGIISACAGTASISPNIQQFTVSASNLTGNVTATAPVGFEVSLSSGSGFGSSISIPQNSGTVSGTVVYVQSAATAPTGGISGNVTLTSPGAGSQTVAVTGTVNALPTVNSVPDQTVNNGAATTAVNFTGTGNTFTWVNDTPGIGLAASGSGNIASFTAVNTGSSPVKATITVTPASDSYAYIASTGALAVDVINTTTQNYAGNIPTPVEPVSVAVSPDGIHAFATGGTGGGEVISTATNTVVGYIDPGLDPWGIAVSPDSKHVYVANQGDNTVSVLDALTYQKIATVAVGANPYDITVSPDGSVVAVGNLAGGTISIINTSTNQVVASPGSVVAPEGLVFTPDGTRLYVANALGGNITVFNTVGYSVLTTIAVGSHPSGLAISPDGRNIYVTNTGDNTMSVISTATNKVTSTIGVGNSPEGISVTPDGRYVYEANVIGGDVWIIDVASGAVVKQIGVGQNPWAFGNFIAPGSGCVGQPVTFTITVNPTTPSITTGAVTGSISACAGSASASPYIEQFTVSGIALTGNITATAPAGFEVSLSAAGGYGSSIVLPEIGGAVNNTIVYVRSAANAPTGGISGNIILTSAGVGNQTVAVMGTVNALPTVNAVASQTLTNGSVTAGIGFTGTGNAYTWVNDTPGIGLAASGMGDISSFTAVNTGNTPVTATITVTPALAPFAYITNPTGVSVINTLTDTQVPGTIPVASAYGVAISPDGTLAYISGGSNGLISIINTSTNKVIGTIATGYNLGNETISADGSKLYVACYPSLVLVVDTKTRSVINTIPADSPSQIVLSPDGSKLWVVTSYSGIVSVYNTATSAMISSITVGLNPLGITLSPDGSLAYVAVTNSNYVSVINTATYKVVSTISVGTFPTGVTLNADGSLLYVAEGGSNSVSVINTSTQAVVATIGVGNNPDGLSLTPDGSQLIVSNSNAGTVSIINTANNTLTTTVTVGGTPSSFGNFISNNTGCTGAPITFTITVNPSVPTMANSVAYGTISTCVNTTSASPFIQQFNVSGIGLTDNITATAPAGFEISLTPGGGYGASVVVPQTGGVIDTTVIYVRSVPTPTAGVISGSVTLASAGAASQTVAVAATINGPLSLNPVANQTVTNGQATNAVNFNGTGNTVDWVNDTPSIGLAASGSGNIASFTAINTGNAPVVATVTATPVNAGFAYLANILNNTVSVVNTATYAVAATVPVGNSPLGVAISPDGHTVYVTNSGITAGGGRSNTLSEINTANNTVTTVQVGPQPYGIALSPDGKLAYVAVSNFNYAYYSNLAVFNTFTNTVVTYILVGVNPTAVAINADGSRVYVANASSGTVSVINTANNTVIANIATDSPVGIAISPGGKTLYVTSAYDNTVSVVDASTNTVTATIAVGKNPGGISISPDGSKVYVANIQSNTVSVISTATNSVTATITVASNPNGISVSPDGARLYAGSTVINTATNAIITTLPVPNASLGNFISSATGCSSSPVKFTITVNPPAPAINPTLATGTISACAGVASVSPQIQQFTVTGIGLTANITATAPAGFEVSLAAGSGYGSSVIIAQAGGSVSNTVVYVRSAASLQNGTTTANVLLSSPGAPDQNVSVSATVNQIVAASLTISASANNICAGAPVTFTATPTNSGNSPVYQWLVNGINAGTNSPTFSTSTLANGDVVSCTMTGSSACVTPATANSNSIAMNVAADVAPSVTIAASQNTVCAGTTVTFTATPTNGGNAPVYQWLVNGNNAGTNSQTFSDSNFNNGDQVSCVMTSNAACAAPAGASSNTVNIGVNSLVSPAISITASQNNVCQGTDITFTATPTNGGSAPVYQWLVNGNATGTNSPTFTSSTLSNGDVVSCRLTSNVACLAIGDATSNDITMTVNTQAAPAVSVSVSENGVCTGTTLMFTASPANGGATPAYQWLINGNAAGTNSPTFSSNTLTNGDLVSCVLTSSSACAVPASATSNTITADIFPAPFVKAGGNKTIEKGGSVVLTATASADVTSITWSPATGLDNSNILTPRASPASTTVYNITVQTADGCMATDSVTVNVFDGISIPNTFTPNGDGINDKWDIQNLKDYQNCLVLIFDRYGGQVFNSKGYNNPWDGTFKGRPAPVGTYYYLINLNNGTPALSGFVALIR